MLTPKQERLLRYIETYAEARGGVPPSFREMRAELGLNSLGAIHAAVGRLIERGFLTRMPGGRHRSLKTVRPQSQPWRRVYDLGWRAGFAAALKDKVE